MPGKRMLILPDEVVKKIDDNRGDLSQAEFLDFLIENQLQQTATEAGIGQREFAELRQEFQNLVSREKKLATKEELQIINEDTKRLLKSFIDFFMKYGIELGDKDVFLDMPDLTGKSENASSEGNGGREVKIKWKK